MFLVTSTTTGNIDEALSAIAHYFPDAESSARLKTAVFGVDGIFSRSNGEPALLRALITHPASASISDGTSSLEKRAEGLLTSDRAAAIQLAFASLDVGSERGKAFVMGLVRGVSNAPDLLGTMPIRLLAHLLQQEPRLLTRVEVWRAVAAEQKIVASLLWACPRAHR